MDVFRLGLYLLIIGGAAAQLQLEPQDLVVLRGSQARFNCSTAQAQSAMTWKVNKLLVVTILASSVQYSDARFSARNLTTPGNYKWEFIISSVQRSDDGTVECQVLDTEARVSKLSVQERGSLQIVSGNRTVTEGVQTDFQCKAEGWFPAPSMSFSVNGVVEKNCNSSGVQQGNVFNSNCTLTITAAKNSSVQCLAKVSTMSSPDSSIAFLTVAPKASTRDQTILIAVTVAFSAAALLFLLIVLIIICCKKRKRRKSTYQEEVRRAQLQSQHRAPARLQSQHRAPATAAVRGRDNQGYVTDGHNGNFNGGVWHTNYSNKQQTNYPMNGFFEDGPSKHRHMTMV